MTDELLIAALFVVFGFFEFFNPAEAGHGREGRFRNIIYAAFVLTVGAFCSAAIYKIVPFEMRILKDLSPLQVVLYALAYVSLNDFLFYWYHRAQHKWLALWSLHELHHSDAELNVISSYRTYWLDYPAQTVLVNAPVIFVLGFHQTGVMLAVAILIFFLMFSHANMKLDLGWMSRVVVGPQVHRIHHSRLPQHRDKNLAQVWPIYDILFGTYYHPAPGEYPPTGTHSLATDASFAQTLVRPLSIWQQVWKKARKGRAS